MQTYTVRQREVLLFIKSTLEERKPGGLGLHLIQHMVDHLEYDYQSGRTKIRFTKESQQNDV